MAAAPGKKSATVDEMDIKLTHALQTAPRAPFAVIGSVLGVSEQTVARRYRRLRTSGAARVIGFVDPEPLGRQNWMLRLFCRPDASGRISHALARRDDVQWVAILQGGTEVDCVLRPRTLDDQDQLLLQQLPRTVQITGIEAEAVLHVFRGSTTQDWRVGPDFLTPDQEAQLLAGTPERSDRPVQLTERDEPLLQALMLDGRASYADLCAAGGGWTEAQVRRRVTELREGGLLYFDVDLDDAFFGNPLVARVLLTVAPAHLHAVGEAMARHPSVRFCAATTGSTSIMLSVGFPDVDSLYRFVSEDVARLDGVAQAQVEPITRAVKRAGTIVR
ncbi:Lrp/AsnC family transcriptional regulator [Flexivirga caeni]|uniref:AsnC family transcriptional regulator n=1 Tax=Flexivirga caeni TaxID=2294115 RepID=A0A3M9M211_9MICO|nr:AsnC family transcriptional regulator [Flexivirga caeni]RNI19502.1 AsnC family transcriptional regulator [Flexivirga caeni]